MSFIEKGDIDIDYCGICSKCYPKVSKTEGNVSGSQKG